MKKTTLRQRINNSVNAFWDDDWEKNGESGLSLAGDSGLLKSEAAAPLNNKADLVVKILKRTFIFLPGTLYLFFAAMFGFSFPFFWENPITILVVFLIGSFMTIFGIGDLKNPKHFVIPFSIAAVGFMAYLLFSSFGELKYLIDYGIYFFPLALIVPFLAKNWVDKTE